MATTFLEVKNRAFSVLDAAINNAVGTLDVTAGGGAAFPSSFPFHITIDAEILSVTNRVTDTLTVTRAQQSTSAAAHAAAATVSLNITAKSISDLNTAVNTLEAAGPSAHAASHENGGGDEISVAGLSGLLADDQHVLDSEVISAIQAEPTLDLTGVLTVTQQIILNAEDQMWIGPAGITANQVHSRMTTGLTINQEASDDIIFALKSSDVDHGLTTGAPITVELDDYFVVAKAEATRGGVHMQATAEDDAQARVMRFSAIGGTAQAFHNVQHEGLMQFYVAEHNDANALANLNADGNAFTFKIRRGGADVAILHMDEDGDFFVTTLDPTNSNSVAAAVFADAEDDEQLIRAFHLEQNAAGIIRTEWDDFIRYNEADLIRTGILSDRIDAGGMTNQSQLIRLYGGAIWQGAVKRMKLEARIEQLERKMLPEGV